MLNIILCHNFIECGRFYIVIRFEVDVSEGGVFVNKKMLRWNNTPEESQSN